MKRLGQFMVLWFACLGFTHFGWAQEEKSEEANTESTEKTEESTGATQEEPSPASSDTENSTEVPSEDPTVDKSFDGILQRYSDINTRLDEKKREFDVADSQQSIELRDQIVRLTDEAKLLVEELRVVGVAVLDAGDSDESHQKVFETLTGIVINDAYFEKDFGDVKALDLGQILIDHGIDVKYFQQAAEAKRLVPSGKEILRELVLRTQEARADDLPRVKLTTSKGEIVLELFENEAPETVSNFISLVKAGYYDGLKFHRVLDGFMAQTGCPKGDGTGGPGYNIHCECYKPLYRRHFTGSLSMAKTPARNTGGSQFFITFARTENLDGKHTVFGRVIEGMDVANSLQRIDPRTPDDRITPDTIEKAEVLRDRGHEYKPAKVGG